MRHSRRKKYGPSNTSITILGVITGIAGAATLWTASAVPYDGKAMTGTALGFVLTVMLLVQTLTRVIEQDEARGRWDAPKQEEITQVIQDWSWQARATIAPPMPVPVLERSPLVTWNPGGPV